MEIDVAVLLGGIGAKFADFFANSFFFSALKFFLFVYTAVLLVDVILLLITHGVSQDVRRILYGTTDRPLVPKNSVIKRWEGILSRLESNNPSQYKVAILEADALADEILNGMGYSGENMAEKLESVWGGQLETRHTLRDAHEVRNRIVHQENFSLSREEAERVLENYRKFFEELELL